MSGLIDSEMVTCPYCWQQIEVTLDLSVEDQRYVEDCSVCCRPIVIRCRVEGNAVVELSVGIEND